jgi:TPR repeat protein
VVTTTEQGGGLVARGLAAIRSKKSPQPFDKTDPEELFADAVAAGKRKQTAEAIRLATAAANQGHARSQEFLGALYSLCPEDSIRDYVLAYKWYHLASEHLPGTDYWWMRDEVIKSRDWVGKWMLPKQVAEAQRLASEWSPNRSGDDKEEDSEKQFNIGQAYFDGDGVTQSYPLAVEWWLKAANRGCAAAQHELGNAYANGFGVEADQVAAHTWFTLAWESTSKVGPKIFNSPSSEECRDHVEQFMTGEQIAEAYRRAKEWMVSHASDFAS